MPERRRTRLVAVAATARGTKGVLYSCTASNPSSPASSCILAWALITEAGAFAVTNPQKRLVLAGIAGPPPVGWPSRQYSRMASRKSTLDSAERRMLTLRHRGRLRPRPRPGHVLLPRHPLRPRRRARRLRPAALRADLPAARLGGARPGGDLADAGRDGAAGAGAGERLARRRRRHRHHQPARDDAHLGPRGPAHSEQIGRA